MSATPRADSGGKSRDDSSDCRLSNRELCTTKFHCAECHCFMNFTKYEKDQRERKWTDREPDAFSMERLEPKVRLQHFVIGPFQSKSELSASIAVNFQNTVRCFGLGNCERQFVSHFPMKAYECCICYDKLWMSETELSLQPRCANFLPAMQLLCIHKTYIILRIWDP